jgi:glutamine amidotransferase
MQEFMSSSPRPPVAIVDYGMGNLFSVKRACEWVGLEGIITSDKKSVLEAPAVILPGIGAFEDAMETLKRHDLVAVLREVAFSGKPFLGVCLGLQLLMSESYEFGCHKGLNIIEGDVVRLGGTSPDGRQLKVPHVGWNRIFPDSYPTGGLVAVWKNTLLEDVPNHSFMYFVHSYFVRPAETSVVASITNFGSQGFPSAVRSGNIFACQFHPERSGPVGLKIYEKLASMVNMVAVG